MPALLTAAGFATVFPASVQLAARPAVLNKVVRFVVLSVHFATARSAPKFGFGLMITFTVAVSAQPMLLAAISWYRPVTETAAGFATGLPPNVQFVVSPAVVNCVVRLTVPGLQAAAVLSAPKFGLGVKFQQFYNST